MSNKMKSVLSSIIAVTLAAILVIAVFAGAGSATKTAELTTDDVVESTEAPAVEPEEPSEPAEEPSAPVEEPSEPAEEPSEAPVEEPSEPVEEPSEPAEEPSEPAEEPSEPAEQPSEPVTVPPLAGGILGDVDKDGVCRARDARLALRASAKLETLDAEQIVRADVDGDGKLFAREARMILRYSARLVPVADFEAKVVAKGITACPLTDPNDVNYIPDN